MTIRDRVRAWFAGEIETVRALELKVDALHRKVDALLERPIPQTVAAQVQQTSRQQVPQDWDAVQQRALEDLTRDISKEN